ncbi:hypothetical protein ACIHCQ_35340 [Streptomyces sp. NPDC052236]|uniref:hypothetical protein n=1 Tax=Streptomyces sp. NPDC052236 TaxID=3365686 RepID=UPI0037D56EA2
MPGARLGPRAAVEESANPGFDGAADARGHPVEFSLQTPVAAPREFVAYGFVAVAGLGVGEPVLLGEALDLVRTVAS